MPNAWARCIRGAIRLSPSRREYSVWRWQWTNSAGIHVYPPELCDPRIIRAKPPRHLRPPRRLGQQNLQAPPESGPTLSTNLPHRLEQAAVINGTDLIHHDIRRFPQARLADRKVDSEGASLWLDPRRQGTYDRRWMHAVQQIGLHHHDRPDLAGFCPSLWVEISQVHVPLLDLHSARGSRHLVLEALKLLEHLEGRRSYERRVGPKPLLEELALPELVVESNRLVEV